MVTRISCGTRKARKPRQCFDCYREIPIGATYAFQNNIYDGRFYTLFQHVDCAACARKYQMDCGHHYYDDDGCPPLRDDWLNSGAYEENCDAYRGFFPHVVARMELTDQLRGQCDDY